MRIHDLTITLTENLATFPSDPGIKLRPHYQIIDGKHCNITEIGFGSHTSTHVDVPRHFLADGATCETVSLAHFFGPAKVYDLRPILGERKLITAADLEMLDIAAGDIILLNTGNTALMRLPYFSPDYVSLGLDAAQLLVQRGVRTVGIDYLSVETAGAPGNPVHHALLDNGVCVIEGLVFDQGLILQGGYTLSAMPLKIIDGDGSPVRAALMDERRLELVIFDMDGLMLDTEPIGMQAWMKAGASLGFDISQEFYHQLIGKNARVAHVLLQEHLGPAFDYEKGLALYIQFRDEYIAAHGMPIKPGLIQLLDQLDACGLKKCVASSTSRTRATHMLTISGLIDRFDAVICGDDVQESKPHPEIFLTAAARFGVDAKHCLVLEDSVVGVEAAYRADMRVICVPDMLLPDAVTLGRVSTVCNDLAEAAGIIAQL